MLPRFNIFPNSAIFFSINSSLSPELLRVWCHLNQKPGRNLHFLSLQLTNAQGLSIPYPAIFHSPHFSVCTAFAALSHSSPSISHTLLIPIILPSNPSSNCFQENLSESHSWSNHSQLLKSFCESLITYRINNSLARRGEPCVLIFFLIPNFSLHVTFQASTLLCFLCYWKDPCFHSCLGVPSFHCLCLL